LATTIGGTVLQEKREKRREKKVRGLGFEWGFWGKMRKFAEKRGNKRLWG